MCKQFSQVSPILQASTGSGCRDSSVRCHAASGFRSRTGSVQEVSMEDVCTAMERNAMAEIRHTLNSFIQSLPAREIHPHQLSPALHGVLRGLSHSGTLLEPWLWSPGGKGSLQHWYSSTKDLGGPTGPACSNWFPSNRWTLTMKTDLRWCTNLIYKEAHGAGILENTSTGWNFPLTRFLDNEWQQCGSLSLFVLLNHRSSEWLQIELNIEYKDLVFKVLSFCKNWDVLSAGTNPQNTPHYELETHY